MSHCSILSIKDLGQFFQGGTLRLNIEEVDKEEFDEDPDLPSFYQYFVEDRGLKTTYRVNERQVPVMREILPSNGIGVAGLVSIGLQLNIRGCLLPKHQRSLDRQVHDHETLSAKAIWQDLE